MKAISIPKGGLIPTYVLVGLLLLDMASPGPRRYLLIDQFKDGVRSAFSPSPVVTVSGEGVAEGSTPTPEGLTNVKCTHALNAYTSDCQPYGRVEEKK